MADDIKAVTERLLRKVEEYIGEYDNPRVAPNLYTDAYTVARFALAQADDLAAARAERERFRAALQWTEALAAWATNALGIATDRRIPSADMISDGEAIVAQTCAALSSAPATGDEDE